MVGKFRDSSYSTDFSKEVHKTNKILHALENLNFASPFRDWDDGDYSIQKFRERASAVRKEMVCTQAINFLASMVMMVPLWYTGILDTKCIDKYSAL